MNSPPKLINYRSLCDGQQKIGMYEVEKILQTRETKKGKEYKVKWLGYSEEECTWEPRKNLMTARIALEEFERASLKEEQEKSKELLPSRTLNSMQKSLDHEPEPKMVDEYEDIGEAEEDHPSNDPDVDKKRPKSLKKRDLQEGKLNLEVVGMGQWIEAGPVGYWVKVTSGSKVQQKWVPKSQLKPKYLSELCDFYEKHIVFKK